jgi:ribosomal protein L23
MALFGKKTEKKEVKVATKPAVVKTVKAKPAKVAKAVSTKSATKSPAVISTATVSTSIILRPHITEKAGLQNEAFNVYTFQVAQKSTKHTISKAITALYKVVPSKVRVVNLPARAVFVRGKHGTQSAVKKAMVYLKKGDKIEIA